MDVVPMLLSKMLLIITMGPTLLLFKEIQFTQIHRAQPPWEKGIALITLLMAIIHLQVILQTPAVLYKAPMFAFKKNYKQQLNK